MTETKTNSSDKLDSNTTATRKVLPIIKHLASQKGSVKGTKSLCQDTSKGLETFRKVFSRSVGPGIKTALAKVFRKPPSGSRGGRSMKSVNKISQTVKEFKENKEEKCSIKSSMSYESLEQLGSLKYVEQRHWRSTEALTGTTKKWVGVRKEPIGWLEQSCMEDPNGSDCESIFSVDSLSSAYATALAEQLEQEECDFSEDESEDSEMSQDSLVMDSCGKHVTARPAQGPKKVSSHFGELQTLCRNKDVSKEIPAEVFWSLQGSPKLKMKTDTGLTRVSRLGSEYRPPSGASIREPDSLLALTDAWSSTDAVDSPRMSLGHSKQDAHTPRENTSLSSLELSDIGNISPRSDSIQGDLGTLEEQNTSFENTLIQDSHESTPSFVTVEESVERSFKESNAKPCTTRRDSDGVAHTNKPTNDSRLLEHTVTEELISQSFSKDGEISTGMNTLQCFNASSSKKDQQIHPTSSPKRSLKLNSLSHDTEDPDVLTSKAQQGHHIKMDHSSNNGENVQLNHNNGKTVDKRHEENDSFNANLCTAIANKDVTKDSDLTIKQSDKHDGKMTSFDREDEHFGGQLVNDQVTDKCKVNENFPNGNIKSPNKSALLNMDQEQSTCSVVNSELLKHTADQELEKKEIDCTPKNDALKTVINRDHSNISSNSIRGIGLTVSNSANFRNSEIKNVNENNKEDKNDGIQIMERKMFNNKYFQMSDSAVNDKISEVVKEHFPVSLREDCGEDHESETTKEKISSAELEDLKSKKSTCEFQCKNNQAHLFESSNSRSKPEVPTDNTTQIFGNCGAQMKSRHLMTMQNPTILNTVQRSSNERAEQEGPDYAYTSDNMSSVEYCAIEAPSSNGQNTDASKTVQKKALNSTCIMENGKVTVLHPCMYRQVTQSLKQAHGLDEIRKVDQQNAHIVNNTTKNVLTTTEFEEHNFDSKLLRHLRLFNDTCLEFLTPSSKSNIPQVSLPTEAMVNPTNSIVHSEVTDCEVVECSVATLPNNYPKDQVQKENTHLLNSSISMDMDQFHSTYDKYHALDAQPLSKLAFYEFGPGNLGKYLSSSVSQDQMDGKFALGNSNISIGCGADKNRDGSVEQICLSHSSDDLRENAINLEFSQKPQIHSSLQSQGFPQLENHSFCTSNHLEIVSKSKYNNSCIKESQICINQHMTNESSAPQNHQKFIESMDKPSTSPEVYDKTKQTSSNLNKMEHYNNGFQSKNKEISTTMDASKHFDSNGNDDKQREKPKRLRKAHFKAPLSSSTDSTPDLSLDESNTCKVHVPYKDHCTKQGSQALIRQNPVAHSRLRNPPLEKSVPSAVSPRTSETQTGKHTQKLSTAENETIVSQSVHEVCTEKMQKVIDSMDDQDVQLGSKTSSKSVFLKDQTPPLKDAVSNARDSAMHFVSSDINPFIHTRTSMDFSIAVYKNQAYGSALNISRKHSPLSTSNKNITRCCSVDNGLNVQNSPFSSHLSTYANHKGLSSTLSSDGGSRDQISSEPSLKAPSYSTSGSKKQAVNTSYNGASEELHHSSGQVDEIVLVCSSEYESLKNGHSSPSKCDHGTQTVGVDPKKMNRHRRSSTQTPVCKPENGAPTTWSSLQNMSEHLSDLIYNTSDLLGNIQSMRTGDRSPKFEHSESLKVSTMNSGNKYKRDGCTQTSMDIGVQTEMAPVLKNALAHEVNVIVKVIGTDICNVSQLDGVAKKEPDFERIKSLPDLRPKSSKVADSQNVLVTPLKVLSLETVVPDQSFPNLEALKVDVGSHSYKKSLSSYLGGKQSPSMKLEKNDTCWRNVDLKNWCKKPVLMDRASSPILTVKAARYAQSPKNRQRLTNDDTTDIQNYTENQCSGVYKTQFIDNEMLHDQKNPKNPCVLHTKTTKQGTPLSSVTHENLRDVGCPNVDGCTEHSINSMSSSSSRLQRKYLSPTSTAGMQTTSSSIQYRQETQDRFNASSCNKRLSYGSGVLKQDHRSPDYIQKNWDHLNQNTPHHQEDDVMSLVPSECNTDVLVGINPLTETNLLKELQQIPDDLPMHNKFTNWSGINQQPLSPLTKINRPSRQYLTTHSPCYLQTMESQRPELLVETDRRAGEIEKLRKEREQVLASVHLDPNPHQLTVELTEAKLHYGQGETDTLLKILKCGSKEVNTPNTKQELLDRSVYTPIDLHDAF